MDLKIVGVLLVGILLFGCTALASLSPFIGCWENKNTSRQLHIDSDGVAVYMGMTGEWTNIGPEQIRLDMSLGGLTGSYYITHYTLEGTTTDVLVIGDDKTNYLSRCPS